MRNKSSLIACCIVILLLSTGIAFSKDYIPDDSGAGNTTLINESNYLNSTTSDPAYWLNIGNKLSISERYNESLAAYNKAIELNKSDDGGWLGSATALESMNRSEDAIKVLDKAIEINPHNFYLWYEKGNLLRHTGKCDEAIKAYNKALEINSTEWCSWDRISICQKDMGVERTYYLKDFFTDIDGAGVTFFLTFMDKNTGEYVTPEGKLLINLYVNRVKPIYTHVYDIKQGDYGLYRGGTAIKKWVSFEEMKPFNKGSKETGKLYFEDAKGIMSIATKETE